MQADRYPAHAPAWGEDALVQADRYPACMAQQVVSRAESPDTTFPTTCVCPGHRSSSNSGGLPGPAPEGARARANVEASLLLQRELWAWRQTSATGNRAPRPAERRPTQQDMWPVRPTASPS